MADFTTSKVDGNTVDASEWNQLADLDNAVTSSGQTPSTGNLNQLGIAMAINAAGADFYSDSGAADAYVLTAIGTLRSPHAYFDGMRVRFRPDNANTGASTVNVATLSPFGAVVTVLVPGATVKVTVEGPLTTIIPDPPAELS